MLKIPLFQRLGTRNAGFFKSDRQPLFEGGTIPISAYTTCCGIFSLDKQVVQYTGFQKGSPYSYPYSYPWGYSGKYLLKYIHNRCPGTEVIVITGDASVGTGLEAVKLGASYWLTKPFSLSVLKNRISIVIGLNHLKADPGGGEIQGLPNFPVH